MGKCSVENCENECFEQNNECIRHYRQMETSLYSLYSQSDKLKIIQRIDTVIDTIKLRLLPTFDKIEEEAEEIETKKLDELSKNFNPDITDIGSCYEEAYSEGARHYTIYKEMKQEFLNHQATLLFHLFEKDCKEVFVTLNGENLKNKLNELGVSIEANSSWHKINKELRLVCNVIKHGTGRSYDDLKDIRGDLFKNNFCFLLESDIEISLDDIEVYGNEMKNFWIEFFDIALESNNILRPSI